MNLGLAGRTGLVFGGSRGIGAACARALAGEGVTLGLTGRSIEALQPILAELPQAVPLKADLTRSGDAEACVDAMLAVHGRLDLAVISAGAAQGGSERLSAVLHGCPLVAPKTPFRRLTCDNATEEDRQPPGFVVRLFVFSPRAK